MLNTFEMDTIREIKARVMNKQPVADWEKQMLLDLLRREGVALTPKAIHNALRQGFNVEGVKAL